MSENNLLTNDHIYVGIIDATYILRRDYESIKNRITIDEDNVKPAKSFLIHTFLTSIIRIYKSHDFNRILLCWDRSPYIKKEAIQQFKADRKEVPKTEEEQKLIDLKWKIINFATKEIRDSNFGLINVVEVGYEADDLGAILADYYNKQNIRASLVSCDSDWECFTNHKVDFIKLNVGKIKYTRPFDLIRYSKKHDLVDNITYYNLYQYFFGKSHNNVVKFDNKDNIDFDKFINMYINNLLDEKDTTIINYMNPFSQYYTKNQEIIDRVANTEFNHKDFIDFCNKNELTNVLKDGKMMLSRLN